MAQEVSCLPLTVMCTDSIPGQSVGFEMDKVAMQQALRALFQVIPPVLHSHTRPLPTLDNLANSQSLITFMQAMLFSVIAEHWSASTLSSLLRVKPPLNYLINV